MSGFSIAPAHPTLRAASRIRRPPRNDANPTTACQPEPSALLAAVGMQQPLATPRTV
ncbi:hypothetical protein B0T14DRAFT_333579 [Immersiella caudata]|uniref:Uncharacterized protein n=1 Tax=Immersiella caudata TaxID=314043 RepID=A0AA39U601_9PEZI|nr:hypothetical protein B0T14DRAFT_333579 [Immersiella caudata]